MKKTSLTSSLIFCSLLSFQATNSWAQTPNLAPHHMHVMESNKMPSTDTSRPIEKDKQRIINHLQEEKSVIDQEISCINSAKNHEDAKNCREQKRAAMDKLREARATDMKKDKQNPDQLNKKAKDNLKQ